MARLPVGSSNIVGLGALGQAFRALIPKDLPAVFFCVKAYDLRQALVENHAAWPVTVPFISMSNGYLADIFRSLSPMFSDRPLRAGMTTIGAFFSANGELQVFKDNASTRWGPIFPNGSSLPTNAEMTLLSSHAGWGWEDDMQPFLRRKWVMNAALNTLTAALDVPTNGGAAMFRSTAEELLLEAFELSQELWPDVPLTETFEDLNRLFWDLVDKTKGNENSMRRDVRLGRRTESQYLAGLAEQYAGFPHLKKYHRIVEAKYLARKG